MSLHGFQEVYKLTNIFIQSMCIIMAWQCISAEVTVKDLKKCRISNAVDRTDGDMLWGGVTEDGNVRSECEEVEGTEYEDGESEGDW